MRVVFFATLLLSHFSQARVFNMADTKLAGYLSVNSAVSSVKKDFFLGESSATEYSKGFTQITGTDFGLIYRTDRIAWVFGFESIKPNKISGGMASTFGTTNYEYESDLSVLAPKIGLELILHQTQTYRISLQGAVGTASLQTKTDYTGLTIAPNVDFTIEAKSTANMITSAIGTEWHWSDNTALQLILGYRDLNFKTLKLAEASTNSFAGGALAKGATLTKLDGTKVKYDFSGIFVGLFFRVWIF
jgi:hypothetical protein